MSNTEHGCAVDHLIVLMLENRSFDHLFGLSGLVAPPPAHFGFGLDGMVQAADYSQRKR